MYNLAFFNIIDSNKILNSFSRFQNSLKSFFSSPLNIFLFFIVTILILKYCPKLIDIISKKFFKSKKFLIGFWGLKDIIIFFLFYIIIPSLLFNSFKHIIQNYFNIKDNTIINLLFYWFINTFFGLIIFFHIYTFSIEEKNILSGILPVNFSEIIGCILQYLIFIPIYFCVLILSHFIFIIFNITPHLQEIVIELFSLKGNKFIFGIFTVIIVAPILEEVIFRVYLYTGLRKIFKNSSYAIFIVSLIFALVHQNLLAFLPIFCLSVLLAYIYEKTQKIILPIIVHSLHNTLTLLYLIYF